MSVRLISWVFDNGPTDHAERLVMLALADFCDDAGVCYPSVIGIAAKSAMTERGCRGILRRLEDGGWIARRIGGGRGGKSVYQILRENPERQTGNAVPGKENPEQQTRNAVPKTRNVVPKTRNVGSGEPSVTIKEPSDKRRARDDALSILCEVASPEAAQSFIAYRRRHKSKALSATGAKRLVGHLRAILAAGHNPDDALAMAEERGWASVEPDWFMKSAKSTGARNGRPNPLDALQAAVDAGRFDPRNLHRR